MDAAGARTRSCVHVQSGRAQRLLTTVSQANIGQRAIESGGDVPYSLITLHYWCISTKTTGLLGIHHTLANGKKSSRQGKSVLSIMPRRSSGRQRQLPFYPLRGKVSYLGGPSPTRPFFHADPDLVVKLTRPFHPIHHASLPRRPVSPKRLHEMHS